MIQFFGRDESGGKTARIPGGNFDIDQLARTIVSCSLLFAKFAPWLTWDRLRPLPKVYLAALRFAGW